MIGRLRRLGLGAFDGGQDQTGRLLGVADHGHVGAEIRDSLSKPWPPNGAGSCSALRQMNGCRGAQREAFPRPARDRA